MQPSSCLFQHLLGLFLLIRYHRKTKSDCWSHTGSPVSLFSSSKSNCSLLLSIVSVFTPFVILLGWVGSIVAGHTKRMPIVIFLFCLFKLIFFWIAGITTNSIILSAYAIGNAAGPFMWKAKYQPRYAILLLPRPLR